MNCLQKPTLALMASAALLAACEKKSSSSPPPPAPRQTEVKKVESPPAQPPATDNRRAENRPQQPAAPPQRQIAQAPQPPAVAVPAPVTIRPEESQQPFYQKQYNNLKENVGKAVTYVEDTAVSIGKGIQETTKDLTETTQNLVSPGPAGELRKDSIDAVHKNALEQRDREMEQLKTAMAQSRPAQAEQVKSAIKPNDEMTDLLTAVVSERDPERAGAYSALLVDEIFNEPDQARAKVMKLQLSLRRLSENNLYDKDVASRVAYLQAQLDDRVRTDGSSKLLRDGLWVAGTSVALGAFAGFRGFEGTRHFVHEFSPRRTLSAASEKVGSAYRATKAKVASLFPWRGASGEAAEAGARGGLTRAISNIPLGSAEVVRRDITALGLSAEASRDLALQKVSRSSVGFQQFEPTNMPGLKYAVVDQWENNSLEDMRRIVFSVSRWDHLNPRPVNVASRQLTKEETENVVRDLRLKSPEEGGKDFMVIVDEAGTATPSRMTVAEAEEAGVAVKQPQPRKGGRFVSKKSVAEARFDGDIPLSTQAPAPAPKTIEGTATDITYGEPTPSLAQRATQKAKDLVGETRSAVVNAATGTRDLAKRSVESVKPALRNFDWPWATTVAVGSAIPLYGFLMEGYDEGRRYGEGHEALYLESLIPKDQVHRLTVELTNAERR